MKSKKLLEHRSSKLFSVMTIVIVRWWTAWSSSAFIRVAKNLGAKSRSHTSFWASRQQTCLFIMKRRLFLAVSLLISFVQFCSSGLTGLSLKIPFISLERRPPLPTLVEGVYEHPVPEQHHIDHHPEVYHSPLHTHSNHGDHFHSDDHKSHHLHGDHHHHNILDHSHVDEQGKLYLHDPESTVKFFYKENMHGNILNLIAH